MSRNFFGLEEVRRCYDHVFTLDERRLLSVIPFKEETLRRYRYSHMLVAGFMISLEGLKQLAPVELYFGEGVPRYPFFSQERVSIGWHLIGKGVVEGSCDKTYHDALPLLPEAEEVPMACEVLYAHLLYFRTYGRWVLRSGLRCRTVDTRGDRVMVRPYTEEIAAVDVLATRQKWIGLGRSVRADNDWLNI